MFYGLDAHKAFIQVCELEDVGPRHKDYPIGATSEALEAFAKRLGPNDHVALEATFHTWTIHSILARHAGSVTVANPYEVRCIAKARVKTDKIDAHILAQLLRAGFLPAVQMPSEETWARRQLVSHRRLLVKQRTAAKNSIRAVLNSRLIAHPYGPTLFTEKNRSWMRSLEPPATERFILDNALMLLRQLEERMEVVDERLLHLASVDEDVKLLVTIPGIQVTVAIGFLAALGDIGRFPSPDRLASYFGLVPKVRQSADHCRHGGITKAGSASARWLAIEAAQILSKGSSPLIASYHRLRRKKGHNVAVTALARKLVVVVWHVLTFRQPYRYSPVQGTRVKLRRLVLGAPRTPKGKVPQSLEAVYAEAGLPALSSPSPGERRAARSNRIALSRMRAAGDLLSRSEKRKQEEELRKRLTNS
jgi:transposase